MADFKSLIKFYEKVQLGYYQYTNGKVEYISITNSKIQKTIQNYVDRLNAYDKRNEGKTFKQIEDIIKSKSNTPMEDAMKDFDKVMSSGKSSNTLNSYRCAYKSFCETIIGRYNANVWLEAKINENINMSIYEMIAENAIFASPKVIEDKISEDNPHACWFYPDYYIRDQKKFRQEIKDCNSRDCIGDYNHKASGAIKQAIRKSCENVAIGDINHSFCEYEACHIVPNSTNDRDYFTSIPNLCLLPRAIAGLSDHFRNIMDILNYHAITLYKLPYKKPELSNSLIKIYSNLKWRVNF